MKIWPVPPVYHVGPKMASTWYMYVGSMIDDKSKTKKALDNSNLLKSLLHYQNTMKTNCTLFSLFTII